jgi:hypothetical protein
MPSEFGEQEFVERVNQIIDLKEIQSLTARERQSIHDFAQYLADYMIFVRECNEGVGSTPDGRTFIEYRGPFIEHVLTREPGRPLDKRQLDNFGIGAADEH